LPAQQSEPDEPFFGLTKLHAVHVTVAPADYSKMDPPPRPPFGAGRAAAAPNRPALGSADFGAGNFGFEFTYVPAKVEIDGRAIDKAGLRYKGSGTYMMSARQVKRSLKIDFDRFDEQLSFQGIKKLNLNSGVMDSTKAREALAYAVFQAVGVPGPRTAYADVTLTVPGKFAAEPLGVFTIVEQVDKSFLETHFSDGKGLLLKPEGIRGLPHLGLDAKGYEATYTPKDEGNADEWKRLIELTRLINLANDAEFCEHIGEHLDLDAFARFVAANAALASLDGFLGLGDNYYLYLSPRSKKFVFIPWDLDLAFGAFPMYGSPTQLLDLSIDHPHVGQNKLIDRLLTMPNWKASYRDQLQRISDEVFSPEVLGKNITAVEAALTASLAKDNAAAESRREMSGGGPFGAASVSLSSFLEKRKHSIDAQLAGNAKGYVPTQGFGPGGFGGGGFGPGGFGPPGGAAVARPLFAALDRDQNGKVTEDELVAGIKKLSRDWDADHNGELDQRELTEGLQKLPPRR